jgi:hypothetical protein
MESLQSKTGFILFNYLDSTTLYQSSLQVKRAAAEAVDNSTAILIFVHWYELKVLCALVARWQDRYVGARLIRNGISVLKFLSKQEENLTLTDPCNFDQRHLGLGEETFLIALGFIKRRMWFSDGRG